MLPGIHTIISIPAGMVLIPRGVFYFWTAIGSAIWLSFLAIAGYMLEDHYEDVQGWVEPLAWVVVGGSIAAYGLHLIHALRRAKQRRDQA
jgi:membrane protein DedA with SNARE-associated domain